MIHILILLSLLATTDALRGEVASPATGDSFAPRIVADGKGVILSWIEQDAAVEPAASPKKTPRALAVFHICMSRFVDGAWSAVAKIASGSDIFANWADTPSVTRASDGSLLATWLRSGALGGYVYDIIVSRSIDDGRIWTQLGPLHADGKPAEHGFVSADTLSGVTAFCWLDGRAMLPSGAHDDAHDHGVGNDMTLRAARIAPTSQRPSPPSEILDERTCECCPTDLAIAKNGPIIAYRDCGEDGTRDISLVRWLGEGWSQPQPIGNDKWIINGCPVNGPSISASGDEVVVAWWTGATEEGAVRAVRSHDGGATFTATIDIDIDGSLGRVESILLPSGDTLIMWHDTRGDDAALVLRRLHADGTLGSVHTITDVSVGRLSGFPRAALHATDLWLTCTTAGNAATRSVKVFRIPLDTLR